MRPAECLLGLELEGGWKVKLCPERPATATGGQFSVGYIVENKDGHKAYLKALDFLLAFQQPEFTRPLESMLKAYNFECDLLEQCKDRKLRRIVVPIAKGTVKVPGIFGQLGNVAYLVFELAAGDIRNEVAKWQKFDLAWALRTLHQSALGLQELHLAGIAHQDVKPSNVLVFPIEGAKLSDLGRASHIQIPSETDKSRIPGDLGYAPPEQMYGWRHSPDFSPRYIADLYHLGSLIFFFFLRCSATAVIRLKVSQKHAKEFTNSDFVQDLPYIQHAFGEALAELRKSVEGIAGDLTEEIVLIAGQLCEPDPRRRGDPGARAAAYRPRHDLQAYISRFGGLAHKAEIRMI